MKRALLLFTFVFAGSVQAQSWNVRTSPLGLVVGLANLRLDYKIADNWVVGPEIAVLNRTIGDVDMKAGGAGVAAMYYVDGALVQGPYLEMGLTSSRVKATRKDISRTAEFTNSSLKILGGYHWFWESFNLSLGAGLGSNSAGRISIKNAAGTEVDSVELRPIALALDFSIGLAF